MLATLIPVWFRITDLLSRLGAYAAPLGLRLILAWEFYEAGVEKLGGTNWFTQIKDQFPFPFNILPTELSWVIATWTEVLGGIALLLGLATRVVSGALIILTVVAIAAVHWPGEWHSLGELLMGYAISDDGFGNYKLPAIFLVMLLPLLLAGPGKLSLDHLIARSLRAAGSGHQSPSRGPSA